MPKLLVSALTIGTASREVGVRALDIGGGAPPLVWPCEPRLDFMALLYGRLPRGKPPRGVAASALP